VIISHLRVQNWRNFKQADVELQDRVFVVGPNASGKSNLLDVFRFLRDLCRSGGLQDAVGVRGGMSKIRCLAARTNSRVSIEVELLEREKDRIDSWSYLLEMEQDEHRRPVVAVERVKHNNRVVVSRPDSDDEADRFRLTQTHLEQVSANKDFRRISEYLGSISYSNLVPQLLRYPESFAGPNIAGDPFGREFLDRLASAPAKVLKSRLSKMSKALSMAVPQLSALEFVQDKRGVPHLEAVYEHWRPRGAKQQEDQFSDGTLRLLALMWSLLDAESLLLLEEPELSLHQGIVRQLAPLIHSMQREKKRQVIVTTHSADLLSDCGIAAEEILMLSPSAAGTEIQRASGVEEIRVLLESGAFPPGDVVLPWTAPGGDPAHQLEFAFSK
jgi:predicted ATPase